MNTKRLIHSDSVILVSGGARGITARCVIELAERSHSGFILLGRSGVAVPQVDFDIDGCSDTEMKRRIAANISAHGGKPSPASIQKQFSAIRTSQEIQTTLHEIESVGGRAEYVQTDVAAPDLREQISGAIHRLGPVTGIIHGAGALVDKRIEMKTEIDFETVYSPKVSGLDQMLCSVDLRRLEFLVLFSSIVGFFGNVGQSDYAIANEILNKSAYQLKRRLSGCHILSINWGPWDSGMVTPDLKKLFEQRHVNMIPGDVGARILADVLTGAPANHMGNVQVVVGEAPAWPAVHIDPELHVHYIRRRLIADNNPFLYDHMIGESPVLPATCAAAWVVYACEQLYPGYRFFSLENYHVFKGIVFDEHLAGEHVLQLKETEKTDHRIQFDSMIWSQNPGGQKLFHYGLRVTLLRESPEPPLNQIDSELSGEPISGAELFRNGPLFHGPSFQGVKQVLHISRGKLVMEVVLPHIDDRIQGQFPAYTANPFIYDAIVQCVLIWAQYFYQAPCLPSSLRKLEQFKPVPFGVPCRVTMEVESQSSTSVVGNILVQNNHGGVYMRLDGLEGTISPNLNRYIGRRI